MRQGMCLRHARVAARGVRDARPHAAAVALRVVVLARLLCSTARLPRVLPAGIARHHQLLLLAGSLSDLLPWGALCQCVLCLQLDKGGDSKPKRWQRNAQGRGETRVHRDTLLGLRHTGDSVRPCRSSFISKHGARPPLRGKHHSTALQACCAHGRERPCLSRVA